MSRENPGAFPLFDLLARTWRFPSPPASAHFDGASRALAAPLADGRIALIAVQDAEPPESRITIDDAGRRTITPRRSAPRAAILAPASGRGVARVAATSEGFIVARGDGGLSRLAPDGAETPLRPARGLKALDIRGDLLALVDSGGVELRDRHDALQGRSAEGSAQTVAIAPDGGRLAFGCGDMLTISERATPFEATRRYQCPGQVEEIVWRGDGAYLVALCGAGGLALLDVASDRFGAIGGFPTPPRSAGFSEAANALISAGAFRIAAWDLGRPPFGGETRGALETGRPGLVAVAEVAALPGRKLVAAAYANGQIVIAALGARDELILQAAGAAPQALVAAPDGRTLAVAAADQVSLLSLPDSLFK